MENLRQPSHEAARSFFAEEERLLSDIVGGSGFTFRRGEGWTIDPDTGDGTYDPKFFEEKGYNSSQSLFGALHELQAHLVETVDLRKTDKGEEAFQKLKQRKREKPRIHIWENCRTDIKGNLAIRSFAPAIADTVEALYREKLWPEIDLRDKPRHLQFMYAILRTSMVPEEEVQVDPLVTEAIDKLRHIKGKDVISLATDPTQVPLLALKLSEKYIEPVIEELYSEDLKDRKGEQPPQQGQGADSEGSTSSTGPFEGNYQDYENRHPRPWDEEEMEEKIKETQTSQSASNRQSAGYEAEQGVSREDIAEYAVEYKKVEPIVESIRQICRRIVRQRQFPVRHLAAQKEEGVMIDPGLVAQTFIDVNAGIENPKNMRDFEGIIVEENIPTGFELVLAVDRTASMQSGNKIAEQRRATIAITEALDEFSNFIEEEGPLGVDLRVRSEVVSFGDLPQRTEVLKPLSNQLTEKQRVAIFKSLAIADSGLNNEEVMFANIINSMMDEAQRDPTYLERIKSGKLRKFIIVLTDGQVAKYSATRAAIDKLRGLGVIVAGVGMTKGGEDAVKTYAPDGRVCYDVSSLPKTLEVMLSEYLGTLSIDGNSESVLKSDEEV